MSDYRPDPGGIFASDVHRRIAGHLPLPDEDPLQANPLGERLREDVELAAAADAAPVLAELVSDGIAEESTVEAESAWRLTKDGLAKLTGPVADEPPPLEGAALEAAEQQTAALEAQEAEDAKEGARERVDRTKAELTEAESELAEIEGGS